MALTGFSDVYFASASIPALTIRRSNIAISLTAQTDHAYQQDAGAVSEQIMKIECRPDDNFRQRGVLQSQYRNQIETLRDLDGEGENPRAQSNLEIAASDNGFTKSKNQDDDQHIADKRPHEAIMDEQCDENLDRKQSDGQTGVSFAESEFHRALMMIDRECGEYRAGEIK